MEALGINLGYLLVQIFNFAILLLVLRAWAIEPIINMLEKRRETIEKGIEDARVAAEARANAEQEAESILTEARAKANQVIRDATDRADVVAQEIKAEAEEEAASAKEAALVEAQQERDRILADVRGQVASLAIAAAQKLIGESLDDQRQHTLLNEFFSGVRSGRVVVLEESSLSGASAEVTSALPLTNDEQETIKRDILSRVGQAATVTFRVDPSILGGIIIRVGDKVLDSSISGQLSDLKQSLS